MTAEGAGIVVLERRIDRMELARLVKMYFEDMVKYVADVTRGVIAVGGELHADAEQLLLEAGSPANGSLGSQLLSRSGP